MGLAKCSRRLQLTAGPEKHMFYACEKHLDMLGADIGPSNFYPTIDEPVHILPEYLEIECDFCRESYQE